MGTCLQFLQYTLGQEGITFNDYIGPPLPQRGILFQVMGYCYYVLIRIVLPYLLKGRQIGLVVPAHDGHYGCPLQVRGRRGDGITQDGSNVMVNLFQEVEDFLIVLINDYLMALFAQPLGNLFPVRPTT